MPAVHLVGLDFNALLVVDVGLVAEDEHTLLVRVGSLAFVFVAVCCFHLCACCEAERVVERVLL